MTAIGAIKAGRAPSWRVIYAALACSLMLLLSVYWQTAVSTATLWTMPPYSHGFLVIPAALYFAWARRDRLEREHPSGSMIALVLLAALSFLWLLGELTSTDVVKNFSLAVMSITLVWAIVGTSGARVMTMPLTLVLFAIPMGDRLIPTLQDFTATFAAKALELTGTPVFLEGHVITVPGSSWQVASLCSGISYLFSSTAVGFVYAALAYRSWRLRIAFFVASAVVPMVANALRVATIILIAANGGTWIASGIEHYLYGSLFFSMIMVLLFAVGGRWYDPAPIPGDTPLNDRLRPADDVRSHSRSLLYAGAALLIVCAGPLSARWLTVGRSAAIAESPQLPRIGAPWRVSKASGFGWTPRFIGPAIESLESYGDDNRRLMLYAASYGGEQPHVKLADGSNLLLNERWLLVGTRYPEVSLAGQSFQIKESRVRAGDASVIIWSWYAVAGTYTGSDYIAKVLLAKERLLRNARPVAAFAVAVQQDPNVDAEATLRDFVAHFSLDGPEVTNLRP